MTEPAPSGRAHGSLAPAVALALVAACTTRPNPTFCCTDAADCARFGVTDEERECAEGLTCIGNTCIASSCETDGCGTSAPVCDTVADVCVGCTTAADCARFPDSQVCESTTGACVACVDSLCPSGACADDGTCADETSAVYLHPQGQDVVPCSRAQPCRDLQFAIQQTHGARTHIVFASGSYTLAGVRYEFSSRFTSAPRLSVHGGGATVTGGSGDGFFILGLPMSLRDLEIENTTPSEGSAIFVGGATVLERMKIRGYTGISIFGQLRLTDVDIRARSRGIVNLGALTVDRATISGGAVGIESASGTVDITNLLVSGTSGLGLDFSDTAGTVAFSTIADTGQDGVGTPGAKCLFAPLNIRSTIVWTPASPQRTGIEGPCILSSSIVGPVGVVGATNANPLFVSPITGDYHLSGGSPARDAVDAGPMTDLEGDPRPRGLRYDIGADETL